MYHPWVGGKAKAWTIQQQCCGDKIGTNYFDVPSVLNRHGVMNLAKKMDEALNSSGNTSMSLVKGIAGIFCKLVSIEGLIESIEADFLKQHLKAVRDVYFNLLTDPKADSYTHFKIGQTYNYFRPYYPGTTEQYLQSVMPAFVPYVIGVYSSFQQNLPNWEYPTGLVSVMTLSLMLWGTI